MIRAPSALLGRHEHALVSIVITLSGSGDAQRNRDDDRLRKRPAHLELGDDGLCRANHDMGRRRGFNLAPKGERERVPSARTRSGRGRSTTATTGPSTVVFLLVPALPKTKHDVAGRLRVELLDRQLGLSAHARLAHERRRRCRDRRQRHHAKKKAGRGAELFDRRPSTASRTRAGAPPEPDCVHQP